MNFKILHVNSITPYNKNYARIYAAQNLRQKKYQEAIDCYHQQGLLHPSSFSRCFEELGHQVLDIVMDLPQLQTHWAEENGVKVGKWSPKTMVNLVLDQISRFKPDILFFERSNGFGLIPLNIRKNLKKRFPFLKFVTGIWGSIMNDYEGFEDIDLIFGMDELFVKRFREAGIPSELCPHAFDEMVLSQVMKEPIDQEEFIFIGSSGSRMGDHQKRYADLKWVMENSPLKVWAFELDKKRLKHKIRDSILKLLKPVPKSILSTIKGSNDTHWSRVIRDALMMKENPMMADSLTRQAPLKKYFPERVSDGVFGVEYLKLLRRAKVVLNSHVDTQGHYGNMRTFEACGVGSCLLTDRSDLLKQFFTPDEEIVGYSSREECLEKAKYLLEHPEERRRIGERARERVGKEHTFKHRAALIDEKIHEAMKQK